MLSSLRGYQPSLYSHCVLAVSLLVERLTAFGLVNFPEQPGGPAEIRTPVQRRNLQLHTVRTLRARLRASTIRLFNSVRKPSLRPPVGLSLIGSNHTELSDGCQACRIVPRFDRKRGLERVPSPSGVPDNLSQHAVTSGTHIITVRDPACYFAQVFERQITSPPCLGIDLLEVHCIILSKRNQCDTHFP